MLAKGKADFIHLFNELEEPRQDEKLLYPLDEILFLVLSAVLACAEGWQDVVDYGNEKISLLKKYYPYVHGIPSKSTICTVLGMIEKRKFESWFTKWADNLINVIPGELIAIDGKTLRGSKRNTEQASHVLNAFATKRGIVLAQRSVGEKTNEITELPKLLDDLNIAGAVVSADALNCQKKIAEKIIEKKGDYLLALKGNQGNLEDDVKAIFNHRDDPKYQFSTYEEHDKGHGRIESRYCWSIDVPDWLKKLHPDWVSWQGIGLIKSTRQTREKIETEERLYISSLAADAQKYLSYSREHWRVENNAHWVLDVTFNEDSSLIRNAAENVSVIRKIAMNLIKKYKDRQGVKSSISGLRKASAWSDSVAEGILNCLVT